MGWSNIPWRGSVLASLRERYSTLPIVASNSSIRGGSGQLYAAMRFPFPLGFPGNDIPGPVRGVVFLVEVERPAGADPVLLVKVIHESEGPCYYGASRRVLDALDPVDIPHAVEWRAKCRAALSASRLKVGAEVTFNPPVTAAGCPVYRAAYAGRNVFHALPDADMRGSHFAFRMSRDFLQHLRLSGRMEVLS